MRYIVFRDCPLRDYREWAASRSLPSRIADLSYCRYCLPDHPLALEAGSQAHRCREAGKGFAVVAQKFVILHGRSATAAKENQGT